jgi:hypothetical protein
MRYPSIWAAVTGPVTVTNLGSIRFCPSPDPRKSRGTAALSQDFPSKRYFWRWSKGGKNVDRENGRAIVPVTG